MIPDSEEYTVTSGVGACDGCVSMARVGEIATGFWPLVQGR
jgi:hypothetical protein